MFSMNIVLSVLGFSAIANAAAAAFSPPRPCIAYPTKVSKLHACPTASPFCSGYLGGTASFTRTTTATRTVAIAPITTTVISTTTETEASTVDTTTITAASTVTSTSTSTATTTTYSDDCGTEPARLLRPRAPVTAVAAAAAGASCGIARDAIPSQVSGACNCILASSTTVTKTTTSGVALIQTITETDTVTITTPYTATSTVTPTTTTTNTVLETECASSFYIRIGSVSDGNLAEVISSDFEFKAMDLASASLFELDSDGYLQYSGKDLAAQVQQDSSDASSSAYISAPDEFVQGEFPLQCQVSPNMQLLCTVTRDNGPSLSVFFSCDGMMLGIEHQAKNCQLHNLYVDVDADENDVE